MARPPFAFQTGSHTVFAGKAPGVYVAEPGGVELFLTPESQEVPAALLTPELERAVCAWVLARGGRELRLNGQRQAIAPERLDRPPQPGRPIRRLVSIAPSNAEIVGALGAESLLVGVESSSDFPPAVRHLPRLGPDLAVDLEALEALRPDLVLASLTVPGMERNIAGLERLGLPYLVLAPQSLAEIQEDIARVGRALGRAAAADQVLAEMRQRLAQARLAHSGLPPVPVYLEWWPKPMFSPGRGCWSNDLLAAAGGRNVFADRAGQSVQVAPEELVRAQPEVIIVAWCGVPFAKLNVGRVLERPGLAQVPALRTGRVVAVDESLLGRPGPRVVEGVACLAQAIAAPAAPRAYAARER